MDVDELYLTPPDRFVAARNALAKTHPEVKSLKRPSPSAWLLNVLARKHEKTLEGVFRAGAALQAAQDRVLAGGSAELIQTATRDLRSAIAHALDDGRAILAAHGRKEDEALLKKVSSILRAASVDAQLRAAVQSGRLLADPAEDEDEPSLEQLAVAPPADDHQEREEKAREREKKKALAKEAFEEARRVEDQARDAYVAAEDELTAARQALETSERAFQRAEERLTKATDARKAASEALDRCE
ncbi:MAG: hypothetical protein ACXVEE_38795 [Polyangiales bacterium]